MASFIDKLLGKSVISVDVISETTRDGINKAFIPKFLYQPPYGYPRFANLPYVRYLSTTPYVEMCISTIIDELCSVPWDIVPTPGLEDQRDEVEIEHIRNFFMNPNTNDESFEEVFIRMPVRDILEVNSGILNKVYNMKEELVEVVARDGASFTVNPDVHGMYTDRADIMLPRQIVPDITQNMNPYIQISDSQVRKQAAYFQYGWNCGPMPVPFGKSEIIWLMRMKRTDDHYGYSPVQVLAKSLQMLLYMIESDLEYYNDNNVPKGIIGLDDSDADDIAAFKQQWNENQRQKDEFGNWKKIMHKVPIVNKVPTFQRVEFTSQEMELIEKQKWYTKMVWASFGVTGTELGYTEDAKGSANQIVQSKVFRKKAINPLLRLLETKYNKDIVSEFDYTAEMTTPAGKNITQPKYQFVFKVKDLDEDRQKYELYKLQVEAGLKTINEIRIEEGMDEVEWGDQAPIQWMPNSGTNVNVTGTGKPEEPKEDGKTGTTKDPALDKRNGPDAGKDKPTEEKSQGDDSPLLLRPGERPTGYKKLEQAIDYSLKQSEAHILSLVEAHSPNAEEKGLAEIAAKIKQLISLSGLREIVNSIVKNNYLDGWDSVEKELDVNLIPDQNAINFISKYTYENIQGMTASLENSLREILQRSVMEGQGVFETRKAVQEAFETTRARAETIARTESNRAANYGRLHGYETSKMPGKKVWSAHLDNRTSDLCKSLNGQSVDINDNFVAPDGSWEGQAPPSHPNCRCAWIFRPA